MNPQDRRTFLKGSVGSGLVVATASSLGASDEPADPSRPDSNTVMDERDGFSRFHPSRGDNPDGDYYIGKLMPGFRKASEGPAPFVAVDLPKLPYVQKGNVKEFHLVPQPVTREFLPGYSMNVYGYNGSMPGPTIEVTQGDRVRIVVTNELPEDTVLHCHGIELPVQYDGAHSITQNSIPPGGEFVYEFDVHEEGTFFYHSHFAMQEAFGMVGWIIVHPRKVFDPPVDRDFGVLFQNFEIRANQTISDSWSMDWNWHTINGRSGPFTTPLVCRLGERVRIRILDFSPMQHHPVHLHGHTFWITGHEGARLPKSAWVCRNTELVGVAQASSIEFIANNPGDWAFHCHMVHHMMNHMVRQVGPRIRPDSSVQDYLVDMDRVPTPHRSPTSIPTKPPGYPQQMLGMTMPESFMKAIWNRREVRGMRRTWPMSVAGMMTTVRVLPNDLYDLVMDESRDVKEGEIFEEIVRRYGNIQDYKPAMPMMHPDGGMKRTK